MNRLLIAVRNIVRDRTRVLSTVLIIAVGLMALLIGIGFMLSTYDALQEIAMRSEGHVIVLAEESEPARGGAHQQLVLANWQDMRDQVLDDERVLRVLPRARFEGLISHGMNSAAFFGTGVDPREEFRVHGPFLRTTNELDPWLAENEMPDLMLGSQLADTLKAEKGDVLTLKVQDREGEEKSIDVRLAGLYQTGIAEIDDHTLMVNLSTVASLMGSENISQLSIYLLQNKNSAEFKSLLQSKFNGVIVQTWDQRAELFDKVTAQYDRIFAVMGIIILVVVFLAISNTIALSIYQRRNEIATLAALGTRPMAIHANFILEACLIGVFATGLGMLFAYLAANAINLSHVMMPAPPGRTEGYQIFIYVSWPHYLLTSLLLIVTVMLASFLASYNNARVNIADALA